ncbi:MAG TPA: hypothetical protein PK760_09885 [Flavobacteriales bacterium]|nr:hypothetical protein [Flavobacteriales bacterium]
MNKLLPALAFGLLSTAAAAQFQVNPQMGINFQQLTSPYPGIEYKANLGWQLGADMRFGDRLYIQPGEFCGRSETAMKADNADTHIYEENLVRSN